MPGMTVQGATHSQGHNDCGEQIYTLPETNSSNLKLNDWNTIVSFWGPAFFQVRSVTLTEGV